MKQYLAEYVPRKDRPWNRKTASQLLRRGGFAPSEKEIRAALHEGPAATVDRMLTGEESERFRNIDSLGERIAAQNNINLLQGWWLNRCCHAERPLRQRLLLFWHGHFATSNTKVQNTELMLQQLRTLEKHAVGKFRDMLIAVSRDPAMIICLDGNDNVKGRPNENYARELFELFSLGVGNYTETDIKESARAFTGWHEVNGAFRFRNRFHDDSVKTVLGTTGNLSGDDIIDIALKTPACGKFIARKLLREFLTDDPPEEMIEELADELYLSSFDIGKTVRRLFLSEAMADPRWYRTRIKSPVEYVVGIVRSLHLKAGGEVLARLTNDMGQRIFEPPSVAGWPGHRAWIDSATMLVRLNAAYRAVTSDDVFDADLFCEKYKLTRNAAAADFCASLTLDDNIPAELREELHGLEGTCPEVTRNALRILFSVPEYQMT